MTHTTHRHHISSLKHSNLHIAIITLKVLINFPQWQKAIWIMVVSKTVISIPLSLSSSWSLLLKFWQCPVTDVLPAWLSFQTLWTFHCLWWHYEYLQSFRVYISKRNQYLCVLDKVLITFFHACLVVSSKEQMRAFMYLVTGERFCFCHAYILLQRLSWSGKSFTNHAWSKHLSVRLYTGHSLFCNKFFFSNSIFIHIFCAKEYGNTGDEGKSLDPHRRAEVLFELLFALARKEMLGAYKLSWFCLW